MKPPTPWKERPTGGGDIPPPTAPNDLEARLERLERTVEGMQVLLGKASEYKARPRREKRLPR